MGVRLLVWGCLVALVVGTLYVSLRSSHERGTRVPEQRTSDEAPGLAPPLNEAIDGSRKSKRDGASISAVVVHGSVVDAKTGAPVEGAAITFARIATSIRGSIRLVPLKVRLRTDAKGTFVCRSLSPGRWACVVWHSDYLAPGLSAWLDGNSIAAALTSATVKIEPDATGEVHKTIRLSRGTTYSGRVVDEVNNPVAGVPLEISLPPAFIMRLGSRAASRLQEMMSLVPIRTNAEGRFSMACIPSALKRARIAASVDGSACKYVVLDASAPIVLRALPCAAVSGTATFADGRPAVGAIVRINDFGGSPLGNWLYAPPEDALVNAEGEFELKGIPPASCFVRADWDIDSPDYDATATEVADLQPSEVRTDVRVIADPRPRTAMITVNGTDGEPAPNVTLAIRPVDMRTADIDDLDWYNTDADGDVEFTFAKDGRVDILQYAHGELHVLQKDVDVTDEPIVLTSAVEPKRIEIRVQSTSGEPARRFVVKVRGRETLSALSLARFRAESSSIRVETYDTAPYIIWVSWAETGETRPVRLEGKRVEISEAESQSPVEFRLAPKPVEVSGENHTCLFVDASGKRVEGVRLWKLTMKGQLDQTRVLRTEVTPRSDGHFEMPSLDEDEDHAGYAVEVPAGYAPVVGGGRLPTRVELIEAERIAGRVIVPPGIELPPDFSLYVSWAHESEDPDEMASGMPVPIQSDHSFDVHHVPPDRELTLRLFGKNGSKVGLQSFRLDGIHAGTTNLQVRLEAGGIIRGSIEFDGESVDYMLAATPLQNDLPPTFVRRSRSVPTFELKGLGDGPYEVTVYAVGPWISVLDRKVAGPGDEIVFRVGPLGAVRIDAGDVEHASITAWKARSLLRVSGPIYVKGIDATGPIVSNLSLARRYDIVAEDGDRVAYHPDVLPGESISLAFQESVELSGHIRGETKYKEDLLLVATPRGPKFRIYAGVGPITPFDQQVLDGTYDAVVWSRDGTSRVVARGLKPGQAGIVISLDEEAGKDK